MSRNNYKFTWMQYTADPAPGHLVEYHVCRVIFAQIPIIIMMMMMMMMYTMVEDRLQAELN